MNWSYLVCSTPSMAGCALRCAASLVILIGAAAERQTPGDAERERARLSALKAADVLRIAEVLSRPSSHRDERSLAFARLGALATSDALNVLGTAYGDAAPSEKRQVAEAIAETNLPEAVPYLRSLSNDRSGGPDVRWIAARALGRIDGPPSIPHLHAMRSDPDPTVRRVVHETLLRLGDEEAVDGTLAAIRAPGDLRSVSMALTQVRTAGVTAAIAPVRDLFRQVQPAQDRELLAVKLQAAYTLLQLGDASVLKDLIELSNLRRADLRGLGVVPPMRVLQQYTGEDLRTAEEWRQWLSDQGDAPELFTERLDPAERRAIMLAALEWALCHVSEPWREDGILYVEQHTHEQPQPNSARIRFYSSLELELLGVRAVSVTGIRSNGTDAYARISLLGSPQTYNLVLRRSCQVWSVAGERDGGHN